jgi:predicted metal-dependent HD superfamily phosphohydrolase
LTPLPRPGWLAGIDAQAIEGIDETLFDEVRRAYDSPGRHYHAWSHIEACLGEFRTTRFDHPRVVLLALLFHDAVYVPGRSDNEARSAELAERLIVQYTDLNADERRQVSELIALTASHHAGAGLADDDAKKFIDIDLSVLGAPWPAYEAYAEGVKREYCPAVVSEAQFRAARSAFLDTLLRQPQIYFTAEMRDRREAAARRNIAAERAALGSV